MTLKYSTELKYPRPADVVIKMFTDRAYFEKKYQSMDVTDFKVDTVVTGDPFTIRCRYSAAGDINVPDFAKKLIGEAIRVTQTDVWQVAKRTGTIDIEILGAPVTVHADMKLVSSGAGSVLKLDWQFRCSIPLLGGKIEKLIAEDVERRTAMDARVSIKLLEAYA